MQRCGGIGELRELVNSGSPRGNLARMASLIQNLLRVPVLTSSRVGLAYAVAVVTDVAQLLLGPVGWAFADEILDMVAMIAIWRLIGFHVLLLPTFVLELLPITDLLPTWTGCVALVLAIRKRQRIDRPQPAEGPIIDV
jgi:hypothetical protein